MSIKLTETQKQKLIDMVIEQIKYDINTGDVTAINELLRFVPDVNLIGYLPDEDDANARYNPDKL
jgi:hypothetical protein